MSHHRICCCRLPQRTNAQQQAFVFGRAQDPFKATSPTFARQTISHTCRGDVSFQHPFTHSSDFLGAESSSSLTSCGLHEHEINGTSGVTRLNGQPPPERNEKQESQLRHAPCNLAARSTCRNNRVPLGTIAEQGSVSTLNAKDSQSTVGFVPSLFVVENLTRRKISYRSTQRQNDNPRDSISHEDRHQDNTCDETTCTICVEGKQHGRSKSHRAKSTVASSISLANHGEASSWSSGSDQRPGACITKGLVRGAWTQIRRGTRSRSPPSSNIQSAKLDPQDLWPDIRPSKNTNNATANLDSLGSLNSTPDSATTQGWLEQSTSRQPKATVRPGPDGEEKLSPALPAYPSTLEPNRASDFLAFPVLDISAGNQASEVLPSPVCSAPPQPRDAALDHVGHAATTVLHRDRDDSAARYTPNGALIRSNDQFTLDDLPRELSHTTSFCSTMSTCYSGTVLGIDLDLEPESQHATEHAMGPVWSGPKDSAVNSPGSSKLESQLDSAVLHHHRSITSSALASLLPIAAAEGIVQQNLRMPLLTFHSPTGNLIQPQDALFTHIPLSSSRSRLAYFSAIPVTSTSYVSVTNLHSTHSNLPTATSSVPVRLAPLPTSTLSQLTAPLPEHLHCRYDHSSVANTHRGSTCDNPELVSHRPIVVTPGPQIRGCGGVLRPTNLSSRSDIAQSARKQPRIRSSISCLCMDKANRTRLYVLSPSALKLTQEVNIQRY